MKKNILYAIICILIIMILIVIISATHIFKQDNKNEKTNMNQNKTIEYPVINPNKNIPLDEKPIIYIYPKDETNVSVILGNPKSIVISYPKYVDGWNVIASPSGNLEDVKTNRNYYGLYYEAKNINVKIKEDGFVIEGKDTIDFLEEKLSVLGLNEREINEFIIYWLPKLENNKYNYIRFEEEKNIEEYMPLDINPKPDTIIRVLMTYKPLDKKINIEEQILVSKKRIGYTVVEWGGSEIRN